MPTSTRHTVPGTRILKRRVVNAQSLQLMVRSGVVRRADSLPPLPLKPVRVQVADGQQHAAGKELVQEQGWLSRVIFGPKPQSAFMRRS